MATRSCEHPLAVAMTHVAAAHEDLVRAERELARGHDLACGGGSPEAVVDGALSKALARATANVAAVADTLAAAVVVRLQAPSHDPQQRAGDRGAQP